MDDIAQFIRTDVLERFLRYTQVPTSSDPHSSTKPSSDRQHDLLKILASELKVLGLSHVHHAQEGFVYATLNGNDEQYVPFGLMAHVDTSPDQPGDGVKPILHPKYDGSEIFFPDDPNLILSPKDSSHLNDFIGDTIITASGLTLLGADDKAGVAEIMSAFATFQRFPELPHGRIEVCFTTDEEVGHGVDGIDTSRLPPHLYTMDGGYPGELETECFDAIGVTLSFQGRGLHPGYSYGKMINAALMAGIFASQLPMDERPETTKERAGFFHVSEIEGNNERASIRMLLRDFEHAENLRRLEKVKDLAHQLEAEHYGLKVTIEHVHQYENMRQVLERHPDVVERAKKAIEDAGVTVLRNPIRGGTDGSRLTAMGFPTPNIFAGGLLFHSRREWVALSSLCKAVETILHLAKHHKRNCEAS